MKMVSNVVEKKFYASQEYTYYVNKPIESFTKQSEVSELTIVNSETKKSNFAFFADSKAETIGKILKKSSISPKNNKNLIRSQYYSSKIDSRDSETQKKIGQDSYIPYRKLISERLKYLSDNLDEDQNKEIFNLSKNTVNHFIEYIKTTKTPLVSVDNVGNILFEWRDYHNYNIIMLLFKTNDTVSLTGIKQNKCVIKVSGIISEVSDAFLRLIDE